MSALNICMKPDHCIVMQDAAVYRANGEVMEFVDKGVVIESMNVLVAATGPKNTAYAFARAIDGAFADIDDVARVGESHLAYFIERMNGVLAGFCVAIVGWSSDFGRSRCVFLADDDEGLHFVGDLGSIIHPVLRGESAEAWTRHHGMDDINIVRFDPARDGVHLMELQRRQKATGSRGGQYLVGGHVMVSEVYRDRIERRVLRTWDEDRMGSLIRPAPRLDPVAHPNVTQITGASRADRRRAEKLARKGCAA